MRWRVDGTIGFFNEYAQNFFGYHLDDVIGKDVRMLLPEKDSMGGDLQGLVEDIVAHPELFENYVNENLCSDGRRVWMTWTNKPILGANGEVAEILAVGTDISERVHAEQALRESETEQARQRQFLETLLNHAQASIAVMKGRELRYTLVNPAYQALRPDMEMLGRTYREVFPGAVESGVEALVQKVIENGKPRLDHGFAVPIPGKPDGAWDHQIVRLPAAEGEEPSALIITWDTTEHKKAKDALRELNNTLEQQVAARTALAEKRAQQLQALSRELVEAEERERRRVADLLHDDLQQLLASARMQLQAACPALSAMPDLANVENLLDESIKKARNLSSELSPPVLNHAGLVPALQWLAQQAKGQFGLMVELDIRTKNPSEGTHLDVFMFRAVQELLFNIVKHAGVKKARVCLEDAEEGMVLSVSDSGKGFDQHEIIDATTPNGFGLLSLKERADSIGASLDIESSPGKGSRVTLTVPFELMEPATPRTFKA
ncbi:MAG: PAS domain-containing protein, partial [Desulfosarcinaceae bacterium]